MNTFIEKTIPGKATLYKATAVAALVAAIITTAFILPAEYGIDPTGIGKMAGLTAIAEAGAEDAPMQEVLPAAPTADGNLLAGASLSPVSKQESALSSKTLELTLAPGKGAELKAKMQKGQSIVFSWTSNGQPLLVDMHGEEVNAKADEYTSYWLERAQSAGSGNFVAPFDGTHGWYWKNKGTEPVTVTVTIHGFFADFYRP
jgi:hypothetical protein